MKKNGLIRGALCIAAGTFAVKFLGAIYRIPLVNLIGAEGLGLYQMIFPVYAILLDLSGASLPSALSKIIASEAEADRMPYAERCLKIGLKLMCKIGLIGSLLLACLSIPISFLQGNTDTIAGYVALAPSVFFVSLISCYRGYFQGLAIMKHTATSQILESSVKLAIGLVLAYLFMPNLKLAVAGATFAVTVSEAVAFFYLRMRYKKYRNNFYSQTASSLRQTDDKIFIKTIVKASFPIMLTGIAVPFSHFIDSFLIVNVLPATKEQSTVLYGLFSGVVHTVLSLPVGLCYGIAVSSIPNVSQLNNQSERYNAISKSVLFTVVVALPLTVAFFVFAPNVVDVLFARLVETEREISVRLLRISSSGILLLSVVQTTNSLMFATDKYYLPLISLGIGISVKTILSVVLIPQPEINIYGGGISLIACYFVAAMINCIILSKKRSQDADKAVNGGKSFAF